MMQYDPERTQHPFIYSCTTEKRTFENLRSMALTKYITRK